MQPRALPTELTPILPNANPPATLDMSQYCPPVKNQGACNSCWAFAALTHIECWRKRKNLPNIIFSPQFLVDCDTYNNKCTGGSVSNVFRSFLLNLGPYCPSEIFYPYTSANYSRSNPGTFTCKSLTAKYELLFTKDYRIAVNGNETLMKTIIFNHGAVAIPMFWTNNMRYYKSGIFYDATCPVATATKPQCDGTNINHWMVLTGYDTINGTAVWKVRNSWGNF
jgi:cysteine peptidase B